MQDIEDKTEARLDKISNTKILEMNEYADGVLKEISIFFWKRCTGKYIRKI